MRQAIFLLILISIGLILPAKSKQVDRDSYSRAEQEDSIIIKGRIVQNLNFTPTNSTTPIGLCVIEFWNYSDSLANDSCFYLNEYKQDGVRARSVVSNRDGCFEVKLMKHKYVAVCHTIGYEEFILDVIPSDSIIDLGDIELEPANNDETDDFFELSKRNKRKYRFHRFYKRLKL